MGLIFAYCPSLKINGELFWADLERANILQFYCLMLGAVNKDY